MADVIIIAAAGLLLIIAFIFALIYLMYREANSFTVTEEEVVLERLPQAFDGMRLFFISDFHRRSLTESHMKEISKHSPAHLYLIGGDVTEQKGDLEQAIANIRLIRQLGPTYLVHGNHDYKANVRTLDTAIADMGVKVLDNDAVLLEQEGESIWLVGIDDLRSGRANMRFAMDGPESDPHLCILLTHDPALLKRPLHPLIDLVVAGHTHGGQINLPMYGPVRTSPFYRKYLHGWHTLNVNSEQNGRKVQLFISKGFGTTHLPLRLGAPPEASFITLRSWQSFS
ncbi:metallophosphoesterase [Paenibacillus marinisediminis]